MKRNIKSLQKEKEDIRQLKDSIVDLQCRSMKYNLVFTGLGGETKEEDTGASCGTLYILNWELTGKWSSVGYIGSIDFSRTGADLL
uniref:Uncharacterized protein n=1 Tax=Magallana gigas TaxID=29159 RepID=K1PRL8_MAGGI